jgi:nitrite reductase/ring-hydroxylating ferredoxin subunit
MDRKEFLKTLGFSAAAIAAVSTLSCLNGCTTNSGNFPSPSSSVDFTIDTNNSSYSALRTTGGYIVKDGVVVAHTTDGSFAAVTVVCSHQGNPYVMFDGSTDTFYCPVHGARYSTTGKGLNANGARGLKTYKVDVNGTQLHVYG